MSIFNKKTKEEVEVVRVENNTEVTEQVVEELYMTEMELKNLELHQARAAMQAAILEKLSYQEQLMRIEQAQALGNLRAKVRDTGASLEKAKADYNETRAKVEQRLNVNLENYIVQESGKLVPSPE